MDCPACGKRIPDGVASCPACGGRGTATAPTRPENRTVPLSPPSTDATPSNATRPGPPPDDYDSFEDAPAPRQDGTFGDEFVPGDYDSFEGGGAKPGAAPVKADTPILPSGTLIAGRFEVVRLIGKGGMGAVYQCVDRQLERQVAMKRLLPKLSGEQWGVQRFVVEAKAVASISHPNVTQIHDIIEDASGKYIVMEYVDGETLAARLQRRGPLPIRDVTRVMLQLGMALEAVHQRGIIHRDIKPANIMFTASDAPKLGDFGIAQLFGQQDLTRTGTAMGTWIYASPEQLVDAKRVDRRSDVYSLGATMYEMFSGEMPRHVDEDRVPEAMRPVLKKCLAKSPDERYQSAAEFVKALTMAYNAHGRPQAAKLVGAAALAAPPAAPSGQPSQPAAAPAPTTEISGADGRRRRRSLWRARGAPWSCPIRTTLGVALLVWVLMNGEQVDRYVQNSLDYFEGEFLAPATAGYGEETLAVAGLNYLRAVPWYWFGIAVSLCLAVLPVLRRITTKFRLSNTRLTVERGILFKNTHDFPLSEIQDVRVSQGVLGMLLGYGDIELKRGYDDSIVLEGVPNASSVSALITSAARQQ